MKKLLFRSLPLLSLVLLVSCFDQGKAEPKVGSVGVLMPGLDESTPRWSVEMGQLKSKFEKSRYVVAFGSCQDHDVKTQIAQLKDVQTWGMENIIITSADTYSDSINIALSEYVTATQGKVLCYDRLQMKSRNVDLFIAPSNAVIGVMQFEACRDLPKGSTIEILAGPSYDGNSFQLFSATMDSVMLRLSSSQWACRSGRVTFQEVSQRTWNYDEAMVYTLRLLDEFYSNGILPDAIIAANDAQAEGVMKAVDIYNEKHGNEPHYPIITGMDNTEAARKRIALGKQTMTVDKNPAGMLEQAYAAILKWKANDPIPTSKTVNNGAKDVLYWPVDGVKSIYKKDIK